MFSVTNYQRSANQNYYEVSPHTRQNGHHLKPTRNAVEGVEKREPSYTVGGNVGAATVENSMEVPHRITIWSINPTPVHIPGQNYNSKDTCTPIFIAALFPITKHGTNLNVH